MIIERSDLDEVFGPGEEVSKSALLAMARATDDPVACAVRYLIDKGEYAVTQEEFVAAMGAWPGIEEQFNEVDKTLYAAQRKLLKIRSTLDKLKLMEKVCALMVGVRLEEGRTPRARAGATAPTPAESFSAPAVSEPPEPEFKERPPPHALRGEAPTIEYLKEHVTEDPEPLRDDVVLKDGYVFYSTGEPFDGLLTTRQVRLLEMSGRLLGEASRFKGRTHHQVVKLPKNI